LSRLARRLGCLFAVADQITEPAEKAIGAVHLMLVDLTIVLAAEEVRRGGGEGEGSD
jgi:hypothetical protein